MIPWRFTIETDLTPDQVIDRLVDVTDSRTHSLWHRIFCGPTMGGIPRPTIFEGQVNRGSRSFRLHHFLSFEDRLQTAYTGSVERDGFVTRVRIYLKASDGQLLLLSLAIAFSLIMCWKSHQSGIVAFLWLLVPLAFVLIAAGLSLPMHPKVKWLFGNLFANSADPSEMHPWPEMDVTSIEKQLASVRSLIENEGPDVDLGRYFRRYAEPILALGSTPPHSLEANDSDNSFILKFPAQSEDGYDVTANVDRNGIVVHAGQLITYRTDYADPLRDQAEFAFSVMRNMLSPTNSLRERSVNGIVVQATILVFGKYEDAHEVDSVAGRMITESELVEQLLVNRQMPPRPVPDELLTQLPETDSTSSGSSL